MANTKFTRFNYKFTIFAVVRPKFTLGFSLVVVYVKIHQFDLQSQAKIDQEFRNIPVKLHGSFEERCQVWNHLVNVWSEFFQLVNVKPLTNFVSLRIKSHLEILLSREDVNVWTREYFDHYLNVFLKGDQEALQSFHETCKKMLNLGLIDSLEPIIISLLYTQISSHIQQFHKSFDSILPDCVEWLSHLIKFLNLVGKEEGTWRPRLDFHLYKSIADLRIGEMFDIILNYPDSEPCLRDLKECMEKTDQRQVLVQRLGEAFKKRLLHQGANTNDILAQYIATIKVFLILDPTRVMLDQVTLQVRRYLQSREDTIRCIINSLLDPDNQDLFETLEGDWEDKDWKPAPMDQDPSLISRRRKTADIVSMLISIYPSLDLFVTEFQTLLADRLLAVRGYDVENEIRNLELLKLRFGQDNMQACEVMIKDVVDSKRLDALIQTTPPVLHSLIISNLFWPDFQDSKDVVMEASSLPLVVQEAMKTYEEKFALQKMNRKLEWYPHLGFVDLEIELKDRTLNVTVSPMHATVLQKFEQGSWRLQDLSQDLGVPQPVLKKKLQYWTSLGVLKVEASRVSTPGKTDLVYTVVEESESHPSRLRKKVRLELTETLDINLHDPMADWAKVQNFLFNIVRSQPGIAVDRIHRMLQMMSKGGALPYDKSIEDLQEYLGHLQREGKVLESMGGYRIST